MTGCHHQMLTNPNPNTLSRYLCMWTTSCHHLCCRIIVSYCHTLDFSSECHSVVSCCCCCCFFCFGLEAPTSSSRKVCTLGVHWNHQFYRQLFEIIADEISFCCFCCFNFCISDYFLEDGRSQTTTRLSYKHKDSCQNVQTLFFCENL